MSEECIYGSASCPHCGAPRLDRSKGDRLVGLWQYGCGTIGGAKQKEQSSKCLKTESARFRAALEYIANDVFCFSLEKATQMARNALTMNDWRASKARPK